MSIAGACCVGITPVGCADKGDLLPVVQRRGPELQRPGRGERRCRQHAAQGESFVLQGVICKTIPRRRGKSKNKISSVGGEKKNEQ